MSITRITAGLAASIGRSSRPNGLDQHQHARSFRTEHTARSYCHSPIHSRQWRSVTVCELSIIRDGCVAEEAYHMARAQRDLVVASARHWKRCQIPFAILLLRNQGNTITMPGPIFSGVVFSSYWFSNGHSGRLGEMQQGSCHAGDSETSLSVGR
jgi:hypothetical protein